MRDYPLRPQGDSAFNPALPDTMATVEDPAFTGGDQANQIPGLGGEFAPARCLVLSGPADGGEVGLLARPYVPPPSPAVPKPPAAPNGRAGNNASFLNLYPWFKSPPEGLDMNNPNPPPAPAPPPPLPTGVSLPVLQLVGNQGTVQFSGPAARDATVRLRFNIDGGPDQFLDFGILSGDTGTQIAAKVRNGVDAFVGLDATGTGGTVNVIGIGGDLTGFHIEVL